MASGLDQNGSAMFSARNIVPWHAHPNCKVVDKVANIQEAIELSMNWEVAKEQLKRENGEYVNAFAIVRQDNNSVLGDAVGPFYQPLQNKEAFQWFQPFLDSGLVELDTAGALSGGQKVWILARIKKDPIVVGKNDRVEKYLMLSNSHDGTTSIRVGFTPIRVVCGNTLRMSHGSAASKLIRIKHNRLTQSNLNAIGETVNLMDETFNATGEQYRLLQNKGINQSDLRKYFQIVYDMKENEKTKELSTRSKNILDEIVKLHDDRIGVVQDLLTADARHKEIEKQLDGNLLDVMVETFENKNNEGAYGANLWTAYNAVTEHLNHRRGHNIDTRLNSLWFGQSAQVSDNALQTALAMV